MRSFECFGLFAALVLVGLHSLLLVVVVGIAKTRKEKERERIWFVGFGSSASLLLSVPKFGNCLHSISHFMKRRLRLDMCQDSFVLREAKKLKLEQEGGRSSPTQCPSPKSVLDNGENDQSNAPFEIANLDDIIASADFLDEQAFQSCGFEYSLMETPFQVCGGMTGAPPADVTFLSYQRCPEPVVVTGDVVAYYDAHVVPDMSERERGPLPLAMEQPFQACGGRAGVAFSEGAHTCSHGGRNARGGARTTGVPPNVRLASCHSSSGGTAGRKKRSASFPRDTTKALKGWLTRNILNPYPSKEEKQEMCKAHNLTIPQLQTWFINARIRLWKPCIEYIYNSRKHQLSHFYRLKKEQVTDHEGQDQEACDNHACGNGGETMRMIEKLKIIPNLSGKIEAEVQKYMDSN